MHNRRQITLRILLNYGILFLCVLAFVGAIFWFTRACILLRWD